LHASGERFRFEILFGPAFGKFIDRNPLEENMPRFSAIARIGAILTFGMLLSAAAFGQQVTGTILGRVTDTTGSVVPVATIQILNGDTGFSRTEQADSDGRYLSSNLPLGS
jgi:hypothetical protein